MMINSFKYAITWFSWLIKIKITIKPSSLCNLLLEMIKGLIRNSLFGKFYILKLYQIL